MFRVAQDDSSKRGGDYSHFSRSVLNNKSGKQEITGLKGFFSWPPGFLIKFL
jgi:hypothetical protein